MQKFIRSCKQHAQICIFGFYDFKPFVFSSRIAALTTISQQSLLNESFDVVQSEITELKIPLR